MAAVSRLQRALATARTSSPGLKRHTLAVWDRSRRGHFSRLPGPKPGPRSAAPGRRNVAVMAGATKEKSKKKDEEDFTYDSGEHADLPWPRNYQQTLSKSFTVGGIGLHTGEYVTVRVMPAYAGEGRYFVRVPDGTNAHRYHHNPFSLKPLSSFAEEKEVSPEEEERRTRLFIAYLEAQEKEDDPYEGTFNDFVTKVANEQHIPGLIEDNEEEVMDYSHEEIVQRSDSEQYIVADLDNATGEYVFCTALERGDMRVITVEHLLSALEGCAVDNARIEVEGGEEMPVIDGSAFGWTMQIQMIGLRPAPQSPSNPDPIEKLVPRPQEIVTVRNEDKFITFYPGELIERITYGIDFSAEASVIGKQWFTWARREDDHYSVAVGSARTFAASIDMVERMRQAGYIKGGTGDCALVANGDDWLDTTMIRHPLDEPARHKMLDLIGDLSLSATGGNQALPIGHIVAYKAGHALHLEFAKALREACSSPDCWAPALPWDLSLIQDDMKKTLEAAQDVGQGKDAKANPSNN
eukprot:CAMPEP_0117668812 /NCGR_PEP_ID=MMETSP0804-20121206/11766_1 /TAXON_ID=1074897 /ORGANISM="Tetraselmis astigmatica, Strain CCMP880" /LENGTH=522 /DNA_ID=CAMNT_0005476763 /DNA_START=111 /DNA_END=1679 /DNA_ORIENTATION=+